MAETTIAWTDATWNPCVGCTMVSPGCAHCYAERMAYRLACMAQADIAAGRDPGRKRHYLKVVNMETGRWNGHVEPAPEALGDPLKWRQPRMIFVNSMSDLFHKDVPDDFIADVFRVMGQCRQHTFQVLTKRHGRMQAWMREQTNAHALRMLGDPQFCVRWPYENVWMGVSVEDQPRADERLPLLRSCPAAVRFISYEPALGPLDTLDLTGIHWVIVGGESGPGARPFNIEWARSILDQCRAAGVACFVKQLGAHVEWSGSSVPGQHWPAAKISEDTGRGTFRKYLKHKKGEDPSEWPEDLRVQEFPQTAGAMA